MSDKQLMSKEHEQQVVAEGRPARQLTPAVDIYENDEAFVVLADMPGVVEESLQVQVERGVLSLEGQAEGAAGRIGYRRQFRLSDRVDAAAAEAGLKDGVLTLRLPKSEAAKPRKIAVKTLH